jgi:hypothetical protein
VSSPGTSKLGLELEMIPVGLADGRLHVVDDAYFQALNALRGGEESVKRLDGRIVALSGRRGVTGLDNGFALLETALAPIDAAPGAMAVLEDRVSSELREISRVLADRGAALVNLARHPDAPVDWATWERLKAPRLVYEYLVHDRGWNHALGFDGQAQNGPTIGVSPDHAIRALNMLFWAGPAFIALFANSPLAAGRPTGLLESRMAFWPGVTATSRVPGDRAKVGLPPAPFRHLGEYFAWTFGDDRPMLAIPRAAGAYKGEDGLSRVAGDPSFLAFLGGGPRLAHPVRPGGADLSQTEETVPDLAHVEALQWANFLDFRVRYAFDGTDGDPRAFLDAMDEPGAMEAFFEERATNLYLENRVVGACFADSHLKSHPNPDVARSAPLAASALQWGLMKNLERVEAVMGADYWLDLAGLRDRSIAVGLADGGVENRAKTVLALAENGLPEEDRWALAFAWDVLLTKQSNADRALDEYSRGGILGLMTSRLLVD